MNDGRADVVGGEGDGVGRSLVHSLLAPNSLPLPIPSLPRSCHSPPFGAPYGRISLTSLTLRAAGGGNPP